MPSPIIEHRSHRKLEVRAEVKAGTIGTLHGYAAVFESNSQDFGGWREVIRKGSFTRSLKDLPDVRALYQHNPAVVLGRAGAKTLTLREDEHGLAIEIDLIDTQENRDVLANVRAGNLDAMSFGMVPKRSSWDLDTDGKRGYDLRILEDIDLYEVSVVTWPAYEETEVATRDYKSFKELRSVNTTTPYRLLRLRQARLNIKS